MTLNEAMIHLQYGKRIRRTSWLQCQCSKTYWEKLEDSDTILLHTNGYCSSLVLNSISMEEYQATDWEVIEPEPITGTLKSILYDVIVNGHKATRKAWELDNHISGYRGRYRNGEDWYTSMYGFMISDGTDSKYPKFIKTSPITGLSQEDLIADDWFLLEEGAYSPEGN